MLLITPRHLYPLSRKKIAKLGIDCRPWYHARHKDISWYQLGWSCLTRRAYPARFFGALGMTSVQCCAGQNMLLRNSSYFTRGAFCSNTYMKGLHGTSARVIESTIKWSADLIHRRPRRILCAFLVFSSSYFSLKTSSRKIHNRFRRHERAITNFPTIIL